MFSDQEPGPITLVDVGRLMWVGPLTIVTSVALVLAVRVIAVAVLNPDPRYAPLGWIAPTVDTVVLVGAAVVVYALVALASDDAIRVYRRVAFGALLISLIPDFTLARGLGGTWPDAIALMVMHVAAYLPCVTLLPRLTVLKMAPRLPEATT